MAARVFSHRQLLALLVALALACGGAFAADKKKSAEGQREAPQIGAAAGKAINDAIELLNAKNPAGAMAAINKLDPAGVTLVNVKPEGKQAIVAAGEVDASFDLYTSYAIWEKVLGKGNVGHLLWADYGLPIYGHTYFVNAETVQKNPKLIERFLRATHKGWRDAHGNPAEAIDSMTSVVPASTWAPAVWPTCRPRAKKKA